MQYEVFAMGFSAPQPVELETLSLPKGSASFAARTIIVFQAIAA